MKKILIIITTLLWVVACSDNVNNSNNDDYENGQFNRFITFYGFSIDSPNNSSTYKMNLETEEIQKIVSDRSIYPTWFSYPDKIMYFNRTNFNIETIDIESQNQISVVAKNIGNLLFLRYSKIFNAVVFSYKDFNYINKIAYYDLTTDSIHTFSLINFDARNPIWNEKDNYIYFVSVTVEGSKIMRISKDGLELQIILQEPNFSIPTFDINYERNMLVATRYNASSSFITIYDLNNMNIIYNIDMSNIGYGLYPSFTSDGKRILFVNGIPNDYQTPRNIFIMDLNGDNLTQLTFSEDKIYVRPLNW